MVTMHFGDKMPKQTHRWHAHGPEWTGDNFDAHYAAKRAGYTDIDQNFQHVFKHWLLKSLGGTSFNFHWPDPYRNNYHYVVDAKTHRVRPMTKRELHGEINKFWTEEGVWRWRQGPSIDSWRPHSYRSTIRHARKVGVRVNAELKSKWYRRKDVAKQLIDSARKEDHPAWYMSLWQMGYCRGKADAIITQGGYYAIIWGGHVNQKDAHEASKWNPAPSRYWG